MPGGARGEESACQCRRHGRRGFHHWVRKIPWRREWLPILGNPTEKSGERQVRGVAKRWTSPSDWTITKGYYDSKTSDKFAVLWDNVCDVIQSQNGRTWQGLTLLPEQQTCDASFPGAWGSGKVRPSVALWDLMIARELEKYMPWSLSYWARCTSLLSS